MHAGAPESYVPDEEPALLDDPEVLLEPLLPPPDAEAVASPDEVPPSAGLVPLEPEPEHPRRASDTVSARIFSGFILPAIPHVRVSHDVRALFSSENVTPNAVARPRGEQLNR